MRMRTARVVGATALVLVLVAGACGKSGGGAKKSSGTTVNKGSLTIGAFNFSESSTLAAIYGKALQAKGYTVTFRNNLGSREIVEPALLKGDIDAYVSYAATELTFLKGEATSDVQTTVETQWHELEENTVAGLTEAERLILFELLVKMKNLYSASGDEE